MFAGNSGNSESSPGQVKPSPRLRGWRDWFRHVVLWNERRGSNGEPWFNPETLAYEKREWVRKQAHRIQQQHPSRIYERFVVVGLAPDADVSEVARDVMRTREARKREREAGTSQPPIAPSVDPARDHTHRIPPNPSYPAQVLCSFPEDADSPVPEADLAAFCFPNGITPGLLRRSASMSALSEVIYGFQHTVRDDMSFVILCQNAGRDGLPLYGVCCYSREMLHRPPSVTETRWPLAAKTPLARYMVAAPVCFCLLSHYPFFSLHFQVLETLMGLERLEKAAAFARELGQSGREGEGRALTRLRTMDASTCQEAGAATDGAQDDVDVPPHSGEADASAARGLPCHQLQHAASSCTTTRASSCTADSVVSSVSMVGAAARRARDDLWLVQSGDVSSPHRSHWGRQHSSHNAGVPPPQTRPADPQGGFAAVAAGAADDAVPGSPEARDQGRARSRSQSDLGTSPTAFGAGTGTGDGAVGNDEEPSHDPFSPPPHPFAAAAAGMLPEEAEEQECNELLLQEEGEEEQRQSSIRSLEEGWSERAADSACASSTAFDEEPALPEALLGAAPFAFARVAASPPASPRQGASLRACGTAPLPSIPSESAPPLEPLEDVYEALARCGDTTTDADQGKGEPAESGLAVGMPLNSVQSAPPSGPRAATPRQPQRFMHGAAAAISGLRRAGNWRPWLKGRRLSAPEPSSSAPSLLEHDLPLAPDAVQPPSSPQPRRHLQAGRAQSLIAETWQAAGSPEASQRYAIRSEEVRRLDDAEELSGSRCGEPGLPQEPPALQKSSVQSRGHHTSSSMASGTSMARSASEADDAAALQGWDRHCAPCSSLDVLHAYGRLRIPHHGATLQFSPHPDLQSMVYQRKALEWVPGLLGSAGGKAAAAGSDSGGPQCDDDEDGGELAAVTRGIPYSPLFASAEEEAALSLRAWTVAALCRCLSLDNILVLITAALLERSMVVCCSNLGLLSACVLSLIPLLRPFCWQSLMLPLLPLQPSYLQLLDAPVPFIVGVQYKTPEVRARSHGLIRVNVYKDRIKNASSLPNLPLARDLLTQLAPWHQQLSQLGRGSSKRPIHYTTRQQQQMVDGFCAVLQSQLHRLVDNLRVHTITDVQRPGERVSLLLKDSLIESWPSASRTFMRHFLETQLFSQYSDFVLE